MKHPILRKLVLIAVLLTSSHTFAHDFEAQNSDGVTIYYNITSASDLTAEVTMKNNSNGTYTYTGFVVIPSSVTYNNRTLTVTSIGNNAFSECSSLTSVTIPNSVTSISNSAFSSCRGLTSVTIPNSVTSIGNYAFHYCSSLTSVTIPNSVTSIGNYAFSDCSNLTSVTIPNSVTSIGYSAFSYCKGLTSVTIPNSVTSIGNYTFKYCSSLTSVTIPNSVTSIGNEAFYNCSSLTEMTIGSGVQKISKNAFNGCTSLSIINSLSTNPPSTTAFDVKTQMEATLRIPKGYLVNYQATDGWKEFWNIVEVENLEEVLNGTTTTYNVNANYDANQGTVAINGVTGTFATVNANDKVEFEITPVAGYEIDKVMVNNTDVTADVVDGKYAIDSATEDITFEVTFKEQTFALVLKCSEAGTFERLMKYGESATYKILPSVNWAISSVTFNGADVTNELVDNVYTTPAITCDSELNVVFVDSESSVFSVYNTSHVVVSASHQTISIKGLEGNTPIAVYNTNGQLYHSATAVDYDMNINMSKEGVYLVKVGNKSFKVIL